MREKDKRWGWGTTRRKEEVESLFSADFLNSVSDRATLLANEENRDRLYRSLTAHLDSTLARDDVSLNITSKDLTEKIMPKRASEYKGWSALRDIDTDNEAKKDLARISLLSMDDIIHLKAEPEQAITEARAVYWEAKNTRKSRIDKLGQESTNANVRKTLTSIRQGESSARSQVI